MTELKRWHEADNNTFHNETQIFFSQCDTRKRLSLHELLRLTSDAAVEDYRQRGLSRDVLTEHGYAILVSRCSFRFHRMPQENEQIMITTWEESPEALQLKRGYEITAADGTPLISGLSGWLVVDPVARRIIPSKQFTLRPPVTVQKTHDCLAPGKITVPADVRLLDRRPIRHSDLDGNGHTNNSRYGAFVMDALPAAYQERQLTDFRLNYSKEALPGQTLAIYGAFDEVNNKAIVTGNTESGVSFECELYWR